MRPNDGTVLVVEDDELIRVSIEDRLAMEGISVVTAENCAAARRILAGGKVDLLVTDIRLPDGTGRDLFRDIAHGHRGIPVILMTAFGSVPDAVALVKAGALDYLAKPFDMDDFVDRVRRAMTELQDRGGLVAPNGACIRPGGGGLGRSRAMQDIERLVARVARLDSSILVTGPSGVGKEVVADLIHRSSPRAARPLVKVNCAAIPVSLVESELFGHEKGAFTGAARRRVGRFEQAQGGTLFLDEIAEVPLEVQVKLLRVLQGKVIERVGSNESVPLDVRVIAATHADLKAAIAAGRFREDLYWRLNVIRIDVPALQARPEDVLFLARRFVAEHASAMKVPVSGLTPAAEAMLMRHDFPGNVRELRNLLEHAVALCEGAHVDAHDLNFGLDREDTVQIPSLRDAVEEAERETIRATLELCRGAISPAAEKLGISRKCLWEKMRRYRIDRPEVPA